MIIAPIPPRETERLAALRAAHILDTPAEVEYDDFTLLASRLCGTSIALIGLIDETRQWYKSRVGVDATECPRDITFCAHALVQDPPGLMEVPDAREDIRLHDNPAVRDGMRVRFYAGVPLVTPDNHILGTLCVIDQTPRHLTTEQREGLQALARQVSALLELRQARRTLEQRNAQLERLHHENSQLAGMVAHDLRNPLQVIDGYGKLMLNGLIGPVTPDQQTALEAVTRNCAFMLSLVNDLLSISRLNAGALELDLAETDAGALVAANVELNRLLSTAKDIRIDLVVEKDLPPLRIDAFKIEQVLNNLISNAIKFSWPHTVITVSVQRADDRLHIGIRDQGQGIPEADQPRLFMPFSRTSVKSTAGEPSTGLGLAIARRIVEGHGGTISLHSAPGEGSTFTVSLPLAPKK